MKIIVATLAAWSFFYYDPSVGKPGLAELTFPTHLECKEERIKRYSKYVQRYGWTAFLNHKGWWVSPACEAKALDKQ